MKRASHGILPCLSAIGIMADVLEAPADSATIARVAGAVKELTARFPVYAESKG